jgi:hypothetical protein
MIKQKKVMVPALKKDLNQDESIFYMEDDDEATDENENEELSENKTQEMLEKFKKEAKQMN